MKPTHAVFVYGTLKEGFRNHAVLRGTRRPGDYRTVDAHPLYVIGEFGLPWLLHAPGHGLRVTGQVFDVDAAALAELDVLERVADPGWYTRRTLQVAPAAGGPAIEALAYVGDAARLREWTLHAGPIEAYTEEHQRLYRRHL